MPFLNFNDLSATLTPQADRLRAAFERVLARGWFILGPELQAFEAELAAYLGSGQVVGVNSGTDALTLALSAAGVSADDEVVTSATTAIPVAAAIASLGARPVYADIDAASWRLDPKDLARRIGPRTRAVIVPQLYGLAGDLAAVRAALPRSGIALIEDAAQSLGASCAGRRSGTLGDLGAISFYPTKTLGALGDGGAIWTADHETATQLSELRNYGQSSRYRAERRGGRNSRLDELQAAFLRELLPGLDERNARRRALGAALRDRLAGALTFPEPPPGGDHVYHLFVGLLPRGTDRKAVLAELDRRGVQALVHYPMPLYRQPAFHDDDVHLGVTEDILSRIVSLPLHLGLDEAALEALTGAVRAALAASPSHG